MKSFSADDSGAFRLCMAGGIFMLAEIRGWRQALHQSGRDGRHVKYDILHAVEEFGLSVIHP